METILVVPGLYGSGLQHWQSWLEHRVPHCVRVEQPDWNNPILSEWVATFGLYMEQIAGRVWVVAHSFGCLTTVMAPVGTRTPTRSAAVRATRPALAEWGPVLPGTAMPCLPKWEASIVPRHTPRWATTTITRTLQRSSWT